jgi:hypothetical protein
MPDEPLLREQARDAIRECRVPVGKPTRTWGGPGVGAECAICRLKIPKQENGDRGCVWPRGTTHDVPCSPALFRGLGTGTRQTRSRGSRGSSPALSSKPIIRPSLDLPLLRASSVRRAFKLQKCRAKDPIPRRGPRILESGLLDAPPDKGLGSLAQVQRVAVQEAMDADRPINPDPKFVKAGNCGGNASEGLSHASNGATSPCHPSIRGGPSDALESTKPAAGGQG